MSNPIITWIDKELAEAEGISMELLTLLLPMLKSAASSLLVQVIPIAQTAVIAQLTSTASGPAKLAAAVSQIESDTVAAGITVATNIVNASAEIGLQNVLANQAAAAAPAPVTET